MRVLGELKDSMRDSMMDAGRIKSMTDTFYAFAMTLLVFSFNIPKFDHPVSEVQFNSAIASQVPIVFIYILSFLLLAKFWMVNHREFEYIQKIDHPFILLNFLNMMLVVFIPYSTDLIGEFTQMQMANIIFAANLGLIGIVHYWMWIYVAKNNMYSSRRREGELRALRYRSLAIPLLSVIAIIISFFSPNYSSLVYVVSPFLQYVFWKKAKV